MSDKPFVFVVGTQCAPEHEEFFNKWYNENHIPLLMKSPHLLGVTRYTLTPGAKGDYPKYLALYEFKDQEGFKAWLSSPDMKAVGEEHKESWKGKQNFKAVWSALYEPLQTWSKAKK